MGLPRFLLAAMTALMMLAAAAAAVATGAGPAPSQAASTWDLVIIHFNDNHARFTPADALFGPACEGAAADACFGGMARQATAIKASKAAAQRRGADALVLHAGDQFSGTVWDYVYTKKGVQVAPPLLAALGVQAFVVGNHEFDNGPVILGEYLRNLTQVGIPAISCNLDVSAEPALAGSVERFVVVDLPVSGRKAGLVGLTTVQTPETSEVSPTVSFRPYNESLPACIDDARAAGADVIVLITHLGYDDDLALAADPAALGADILVGSHSHTLLYGTAAPGGPQVPSPIPPILASPPTNESYAVIGPYPTWVERSGAPPLPIVQAAWASRYLGLLNTTFDTAGGGLLAASGAPLLLGGKNSTNYVAEDPIVAAQIANLTLGVDAFSKQVLGINEITLDGQRGSIRNGQTNLGRVICNAYIDYVVNKTSITVSYPGAPVVCATNTGGIRASVLAGNVTRGDMSSVLPMADSIVVKVIDAPTLLAVLDNAASGVVGGVRSKGKFLQVGGLRYAYDMARPADARVVNAEVQLPGGAWAPLPGHAGPILLVADSFVAGGGNGYDVLEAVSIALGARAKGMQQSPASAHDTCCLACIGPPCSPSPTRLGHADEGAQTDITVGNWIAANSPLAVADGGTPPPIVDCAAAPVDPLCVAPAPAPAQIAAAAVATAAAAAPTIAPGVVAVQEQEDVALEQAAAAISALATGAGASNITPDILAQLAQGLLGD